MMRLHDSTIQAHSWKKMIIKALPVDTVQAVHLVFYFVPQGWNIKHIDFPGKRLHLPMQGTQFLSLVRELKSHMPHDQKDKI